MISRRLKIIDGEFSIHRFDTGTAIPSLILNSEFHWISKTDEELSIVCDSQLELQSSKREEGWAAIKIIGPIDFSEIGVVSAITSILANHKIGVFVISTFDTDYVLIKKIEIDKAKKALVDSGYTFID